MKNSDSIPETLPFDRPRRPELEIWESLQRWGKGACSLIQEQWNQLLTSPCELVLQEIAPCSYKEISAAMTPGSWGLHFKLTRERSASMLLLSQRLIRCLLAELLNIPLADNSDERPISPLEESMLDVLFQRVAGALGDAFPGSEPLNCRFVEAMPRPERSRILSPSDEYYLAGIECRCRWGEAQAIWILPRREIDHLLGIETESPDGRVTERAALETLALDMPLEVTVELGSIDLPMSIALHLAPGDVLLLNQSIHRPVTVALEGAPKWLGMPMRVGARQALQIRELM